MKASRVSSDHGGAERASSSLIAVTRSSSGSHYSQGQTVTSGCGVDAGGRDGVVPLGGVVSSMRLLLIGGLGGSQ